jgi:hypothetical protein
MRRRSGFQHHGNEAAVCTCVHYVETVRGEVVVGSGVEVDESVAIGLALGGWPAEHACAENDGVICDSFRMSFVD